MRWSYTWARDVFLLIAFGIGQSGCVDLEGPVPPQVPGQDVFAALSFTTDAMFIAQGQTLQLSLRATAADESSIPVEIRDVTWTLSDSARIAVDTLGRITGKVGSSTPVTIRAKYTHGIVTRRDSLLVYVTASAGVTASMVELVAVDSTRVGSSLSVLPAELSPRIRVDLTDGNSVVTTNIQLPLTVPPALVLSYSPTGGPQGEPVYFVRGDGPFVGTAWIKASINLYGAEVVDSLAFQVTYPARVAAAFGGAENETGIWAPAGEWGVGQVFRAAPCAVIPIFLYSQRSVDVVFSDSTAAADGCAPIFEALLPALVVPSGDVRNQVGGNVLGVTGFVTGLRRSATIGEVSWYVRDAVTKERLLGPFRYNNIPIEVGQ